MSAVNYTDGVAMVACPDCDGNGEEWCHCSRCGSDHSLGDCETCGGTGEVPLEADE